MTGRRIVLLYLIVVISLLSVANRCEAQDTTALISGILGSLTSTSRNHGCPGECVHALTSLLCEKIQTDGQCGAAYLRCCVTSVAAGKMDLGKPNQAKQTHQDSLEDNNTSQPDLDEKRVETNEPIANASNNISQTSPQDSDKDEPIASQGKADCPGICVSSSFYCDSPLPDSPCGDSLICCGDAKKTIEKKVGGPVECSGSCVSSLFSLLCDKVDYTATCSSGGTCCLNPDSSTTTTPPPPPPPPVLIQQCPGRCLPGFMHKSCVNQGKLVANNPTNCPPATICCVDSSGESYTNDRGPDGPGIILTGPQGVRQPYPSSINNFNSPMNNKNAPQQHQQQNNQNSQSSSFVNSEIFGAPRPIQEETVGPISSAELVTKIASTIACPGSCIAPLMKFTCFGSNSVFPYFKCGDGYVCCADTGDVKRTLSNAIILSQVAPISAPENHPQSQPPLPLSPQSQLPPPSENSDRVTFEPRPPVGGNFVPLEGNKLSHPHATGEPQESQIQPVRAPLPPPVDSGLSTKIKNSSPTKTAATDELRHSFQSTKANVAPMVPTTSQGGFVPAFRPIIPPHSKQEHPVSVGISSPGSSSNPTTLSVPLPVKVSQSPAPQKVPSFQLTAPGHAAFLGSKNFNPPFKPINSGHTNRVSTPIHSSGGFIPAGAVTSSPNVNRHRPGSILPSVPIRSSHPHTADLKSTTSKVNLRDSLSCGRRGSYNQRQQRVIGGRNSLPGDWCWQAAIYNEKGQYVCGGALIGPQWIVTAAHCVTKYVRNGDSFYVEVGSVDLTAEHGHSRKKAWASYIHHNYNENTLDNDIALVKVLNSFNVNSSSACTVCLPGKHGSRIDQLSRCTVTGYGALSEGGPVAMQIREVELPMVEEKDCVAKLSVATEKQFKLPASTFCAGGEDGSDACQGDGGSPMVCDMGDFYELKGLVSWGLGCGRLDVPGVYVKVSAFIGWINQIISVNTS